MRLAGGVQVAGLRLLEGECSKPLAFALVLLVVGEHAWAAVVDALDDGGDLSVLGRLVGAGPDRVQGPVTEPEIVEERDRRRRGNHSERFFEMGVVAGHGASLIAQGR